MNDKQNNDAKKARIEKENNESKKAQRSKAEREADKRDVAKHAGVEYNDDYDWSHLDHLN